MLLTATALAADNRQPMALTTQKPPFSAALPLPTIGRTFMSYDGVGLVLDPLNAKFDSPGDFLHHWDTAAWRGALAEADSWTMDEFFNADVSPWRTGSKP